MKGAGGAGGVAHGTAAKSKSMADWLPRIFDPFFITKRRMGAGGSLGGERDCRPLWRLNSDPKQRSSRQARNVLFDLSAD